SAAVAKPSRTCSKRKQAYPHLYDFGIRSVLRLGFATAALRAQKKAGAFRLRPLEMNATDLEFLGHFEVNKSAKDVVRRFIGVVLEGGGNDRRIVVCDIVATHCQPGAAEPFGPFVGKPVGQLHIECVPTVDLPGLAIEGEIVERLPI